MRTFTATDAKNNFGSVLEGLSVEPAAIVKNGKTVAVVISAEEFQQMENDYAMTKAKVKLIANDNQAISALKKYASATISSEKAMKELGLRNQGQLLDLLGITNLPFPAISNDRIESMVENLLLEGESND